MDEALTIIEQNIEEGGFHQVATANVDFLMNAIHDRALRDILCSCSLVVPDGMPILWSARLMGSRLKERVCGSDLVPRLAELASRRGYSIYLLGSSAKSSQRAAEHLQATYPGLRIAGRYSPPLRSLEEMNHEEILRRIEQAKPDILFVAFGNPKQEKWLAMHRDRLKVPVCIGIGCSLDLVSGSVARAPRWMQKSGFEWLFRARQEPKRLVRRYLNDAITLGRYLPQQMAATASQPRNAGPSGIFANTVGNTEVITIQGNLTGSLLADFEKRTQEAGAAGMHIVLNMAESAYCGPTTLGSLVQLMASMQRLKLQLWLAEMRPHLVRLLRTSKLDSYFKTTSSVNDALYRIAKAEQRTLGHTASLQTFRDRASSPVHVQVELLQDICRNMAVSPANTQFDFGARFSQGSHYGFKVSVG
jgi:N-acetylglucosaminyldiphosphoundecaprenol N-acetyl-beta-D-mannosaminyltransferase